MKEKEKKHIQSHNTQFRKPAVSMLEPRGAQPHGPLVATRGRLQRYSYEDEGVAGKWMTQTSHLHTHHTLQSTIFSGLK